MSGSNLLSSVNGQVNVSNSLENMTTGANIAFRADETVRGKVIKVANGDVLWATALAGMIAEIIKERGVVLINDIKRGQ